MIHCLVVVQMVIGLFAMQLMAGDFSSSRSTSLLPAFVRLASGNDSFKGKVRDDAVVYDVKNLSFGGVIKIEGVRKQDDDSNTVLQLDILQKIEILDPNFESMDSKHRTAPNFPLFIEARVTFFSGKSEVFLLPHELTLCGEEIASGAEKAWFLKDIKAVENLGRFTEAPETVKAPKIPREYTAEPVDDASQQRTQSMLSKIWDATLGRIF